MSRLLIEHPEPYILVISKSRASEAIGFVSNIAFLIVFYVIISKLPVESTVVLVFFLIFPLIVVLPLAVRNLRKAIKGDVLTLDSGRQIIINNGSEIATFKDVRMIQVKKVLYETRVHILSIDLRDGRVIEIDRGGNPQEYLGVANEISNILHVEVVSNLPVEKSNIS